MKRGAGVLLALLVGLVLLLVSRKARAMLPGPLTLEILRDAMPGLSSRWDDLGLLNQALREESITTPRRIAAFLGQVGLESLDFRYFEELASGSAYEGRKDLGNTQVGDGVRFKGRGAIQLTGRNNYAKASKRFGVDMVARPEIAASPEYAYRIAAWFFSANGCNELADADDYNRISQKINGGKLGQSNGHEQRVKRYNQARAALGLPIWREPGRALS